MRWLCPYGNKPVVCELYPLSKAQLKNLLRKEFWIYALKLPCKITVHFVLHTFVPKIYWHLFSTHTVKACLFSFAQYREPGTITSLHGQNNERFWLQPLFTLRPSISWEMSGADKEWFMVTFHHLGSWSPFWSTIQQVALIELHAYNSNIYFFFYEYQPLVRNRQLAIVKFFAAVFFESF